jgi:hypothetical protein
MKPLFNLLVLGVLCCASGCSAQSGNPLAPSTPVIAEFKLQDSIGHDWKRELVTYDVPDKTFGRKDLTLAGADNKPQPLQWTTNENGKKQIAFLADVPKFGQSTYRLQNGSPAASDLTVEDNADNIRLLNSRTGIEIRKKLEAGQAPISGVRLASGKWVGASQLNSPQAVMEYSATITARGPVFTEVLCSAKFARGGNWRMRLRLISGEPVVLVSESYAVDESTSWTLDLGDRFTPQNMLYRLGRSSAAGGLGALKSWALGNDAEPAFVLEPWLRWWMRDRQGNWFGLYRDDSPDLLAMGALQPGQWVDPQKKNWGNREVFVQRAGETLQAKLPLQEGERRWMLAALDKNESIADLGSKTAQQAPLPQQYLIKYGDFPLDMVKDYVLDWKSEDSGHPKLLVTAAEIARWKKNFKPDAARLANYLRTPVTVFNVEGPTQYYIATGDEKLGRLLADFVLAQVQNDVDIYTLQKDQVTLGTAPHGIRYIQTIINTADAVWTSALTPSERTKLKAQLAFLDYTFNRADYWSPERGYAANPNMTSMVAGYQAQIGMMLSDHPLSGAWTKRGLTELKTELDEWADAEGGWLEAPAYAIASWDFLLGMFVQAHNTGHADYLYDPKMKKVADWLAMISTPPDARVDGIRHLPPIGNTYIGQPCGEFGIMAYLWKDKDPAFAARMQWMQQQQGNFPDAGIGGFSPSLEGYREMLMDASLPAQKPNYQSMLFPETGVLLRNGVDDRETQLHLIAGNNHAHYDKDSGSITLWGKGRIVADDFGYQGYMPGDDHSMVVSPIAPDVSVMHVHEFSPSPHFDYVRGQKSGWQRQIAFLKNTDMMAPNYFVMRDTLAVPAPATWRLWLTANKVLLKPRGALVEGKEDVDTDIVFVSPQNLPLTTEEKTRSTYGLDINRKYGKVSVAQTGLIAQVAQGQPFMAVIYPRLKTQAPPKVTSLAAGKAVKVEHQDGTDYIFLSDKTFSFQGESVDFEGTSGLVQIRGGKATLSLGAAGHLSALGQSVTKVADKATAKIGSNNLIANGDFETGVQDVFPAVVPNDVFEASVHEGDPAPQSTHAGRYSLALRLKTDGRSSYSVKQPLFVDRTQVYRVKANVYTPDAILFMLTGYASDGKDFNLKDDKGRVWGYSADVKGPLSGWKTLETTIGPPGSNAQYIMPPTTLQITMTLRFQGVKGAVYVDDISIEPLTQ